MYYFLVYNQEFINSQGVLLRLHVRSCSALCCRRLCMVVWTAMQWRTPRAVSCGENVQRLPFNCLLRYLLYKFFLRLQYVGLSIERHLSLASAVIIVVHQHGMADWVWRAGVHVYILGTSFVDVCCILLPCSSDSLSMLESLNNFTV